jgi:hypothetical protein
MRSSGEARGGEVDQRSQPVRDLGEVPRAAQQAVGDAGRAPGAAGDLHRASSDAMVTQQPRAAPHDAAELLGGVEVEPRDDAEARLERAGEQPRAGRGADEGEGVEVERQDGRRVGAVPVTRSILKSSIAG